MRGGALEPCPRPSVPEGSGDGVRLEGLNSLMARTLIFVGLVILALGLVLLAFPKALAWFGALPGDLRYERGGTRVFVPITSMIVVSVLLTFLLNGVLWLLRRF